MTEEVTYFQQGRIKITNARAILGEKTYAMVNITSVAMGRKDPGVGLPLILITLGIPIIICSLTGGMGEGTSGLAFVIIGLLLFIVGVLAARQAKSQFIVRIGSAGGGPDKSISNPHSNWQRYRIQLIERGQAVPHPRFQITLVY